LDEARVIPHMILDHDLGRLKVIFLDLLPDVGG
jgi:hypothetical protein